MWVVPLKSRAALRVCLYSEIIARFNLQVQTRRKLIIHPLIGSPFTKPKAAHVHRQLDYSTVRRLLPILPSGCSECNT